MNGGDTVTGGTAVDVFLMGSGADDITGGAGVDYAWGGGGSDTFDLNGKASDTEVMVVEDFNAGGVQRLRQFRRHLTGITARAIHAPAAKSPGRCRGFFT